MSVELREITYDNFDDCISLKVRDDQSSFVASNLYSLAQAKVDEEVTPLGIYDEGTMVGFLMYGADEEDGQYWLLKLMIDERCQGRGYARAAMEAVMERLHSRHKCRELYLSYPLENTGAHRLFSGLGFRATGEVINGEHVFVKQLDAA